MVLIDYLSHVVVIECLLWVRHYFISWGQNEDQGRQGLCPHLDCSVDMGRDEKQVEHKNSKL